MTGAPMRRRECITLLGGAAAAWPLAARAQRANAVKRIGWLSSSTEQDPRAQAERRAFHQELAKLGWTDGQNVRIDHRSTLGGDDNVTLTSFTALMKHLAYK